MRRDGLYRVRPRGSHDWVVSYWHRGHWLRIDPEALPVSDEFWEQIDERSFWEDHQPVGDGGRIRFERYGASLLAARCNNALVLTVDEGDQGTDEAVPRASFTLSPEDARLLQDWLNRAFPLTDPLIKVIEQH